MASQGRKWRKGKIILYQRSVQLRMEWHAMRRLKDKIGRTKAFTTYMLYLLHPYRKAQLNIQYYTSHAKRGFTQKDSIKRVIRSKNRSFKKDCERLRSVTLTRSVNSRRDKGCFRESFFWTFSRDGFIETKVPINIPVLKRWTILQSDIKHTDSSRNFKVCEKADLTCVVCDKKGFDTKGGSQQ